MKSAAPGSKGVLWKLDTNGDIGKFVKSVNFLAAHIKWDPMFAAEHEQVVSTQAWIGTRQYLDPGIYGRGPFSSLKRGKKQCSKPRPSRAA